MVTETTLPTCPYCGQESQKMRDTEINRVGRGAWVYGCVACDAYVTCYTGIVVGGELIGTLANKHLRQLRQRAHMFFEPLWRKAGVINGWSTYKAKHIAYRWLAREMGIPLEMCHIGMFREDDVKRVIAICSKFYEGGKHSGGS